MSFYTQRIRKMSPVFKRKKKKICVGLSADDPDVGISKQGHFSNFYTNVHEAEKNVLVMKE